MKKIADPLIPLLQFQEKLDGGARVDPDQLEDGYLKLSDVRADGGLRYSYAKIVNNEIQTLSIFGHETSVKKIVCFNVGYAVHPGHRGKSLAVEAVKKGLADLKSKLQKEEICSFNIQAVIDIKNSHSLNVAKKIFDEPGIQMIESESNTPALFFQKIIEW